MTQEVLDAIANLQYLESYADDGLDYTLKVLDKDYKGIIAGPYVRMACERFIRDLDRAENDPDCPFYFDEETAQKSYTFIENHCVIPVGQTDKEAPFILFGWHKFVLDNLFGFKFKHDDSYRFKTAYLETGRGAAKSSFGAAICCYRLFEDDRHGLEGYIQAYDKAQAGISFGMAATMARSDRFQSYFLEQDKFIVTRGEGQNTDMIEDRVTGNYLERKAGTNNTGLGRAGINAQVVQLDEFCDFDSDKDRQAYENGMRANFSPLLIMTTNSGVTGSVCENEHKDCIIAMSEGLEGDDEVFAYICAMDKGDEPFKDPYCWQKTMPTLGDTTRIDYVIRRVRKALRDTSTKLEVERYLFCKWQAPTDVEALFTEKQIDKVIVNEEDWDEQFPPEKLRKCPLRLAIDLALNHDLVCLGAIWDVREISDKYEYAARFKSWKPEATIYEDETKRDIPYSVWLEDGYLTVPQGAVVEEADVARDIKEYWMNNDLYFMVYDKWRMTTFRVQAEKVGVTTYGYEEGEGEGIATINQDHSMKAGDTREDAVEKVKDGDVSTLFMPESIRACRSLVLNKKVAVRQTPIFKFSVLATEVVMDSNRNMAVSKTSNKVVIDNAVVFIMLCGGTTVGKPEIGDISDMVPDISEWGDIEERDIPDEEFVDEDWWDEDDDGWDEDEAMVVKDDDWDDDEDDDWIGEKDKRL